MQSIKIRSMVEAGVMIALATVLSYIKVFEMPQGGSITAVSMLPILLYATRWGIKKGLLTSFVYGILQFLLQGGVSIHIGSIFLDYIFAFGALGLSGLFYGSREKAMAGALIGMVSRYVILVISGVVLWYMYAPEGMSPLKYSLVYNASYMVPEGLITLVVLWFMYPQVKKIFPAEVRGQR